MIENRNMTEENEYNYCSNNNDNMCISWHIPDSSTPSVPNNTLRRASFTSQNDNFIDLTDDSNSNIGDEIEDTNAPTFEKTNVIIIDDSDKEEEENHINNDDVGMDEIFHELNSDVDKVKKLLVGAPVIPSDIEIYAYLEAHLKKVNRVQIVAKELSGTNDMSSAHSHEASPVRDKPKEKSGKGMYRKGRKATAKGEKEKILGIRVITHETMAEEENTNSMPEKRPHGEGIDNYDGKKIKTDNLQQYKSSGEQRVQKSLSQSQNQQMKWNPAEEANLLHDTPQGMIPILEPSVLTPPSLQHLKYQFKLIGTDLTPLRKERTNSIEVIDEPSNVSESVGVIDNQLVETILPDLIQFRKERAPSIDARNAHEVVEINDNHISDVPNEEAIEDLNLGIIKNIISQPNFGSYQLPNVMKDVEMDETILPDLSRIRKERAASTESIKEVPSVPEIIEIVDNPTSEVPNDEDIVRLTFEILNNPTPSPSLKEIKAAVFGEARPIIVSDQQVPELIDITGDVELVKTDTAQSIEAVATFSKEPSTTLWQCPDKSCLLMNGNINTHCERQDKELPLVHPFIEQLPVAPTSSSSAALTVLPIPGSSTDEPIPSTSSADDANVVQALVPMEETDDKMRWEQEKEALLIDIFPDFSPEWLLEQIRDLGTDDVRLNKRVSEIMEMDKSKIPSRKEWEKKIKEQEELDKWSGSMTVKDMLELYEDDPAGHFHNPNRVISNKKLYSQHSRLGLMEAFRFISTNDIDKIHKHSGLTYAMAYKAINLLARSRKTKRAKADIKYPADSCIEFLKEKKFVELEAAIEEEKVRRENNSKAAFELGRATNSLMECGCCYDECLKEDMLPCKGGHLYCKECVSRGANVAIGDGKTVIQCLGQCQEEIATRELQKALPPNVLSKLLSKRQAEEVGAADIENLVTCPYCPYSTIMENKEDKVVVCRNPECGRDSCRLCRQPNHIPLRCEELESQDEEQARKRVEEALSEAIIRNCANPRCSARFMKTEGCNKMCCVQCQTTQCYLCKKVVTGYDHFYGDGGVPTETKVCPLHSNNDELHASEVARAAQKETAELEKKGIKLKHNPMKYIKLPDKNDFEGHKFLVVAEDHVAGSFDDIEKAKAKLMSITLTSRMIAEVDSSGTLNRDPHKVGGYEQTDLEGFNKFWWDWWDIWRMMDVAQQFIQDNWLAREHEHQAQMEINRALQRNDF